MDFEFVLSLISYALYLLYFQAGGDLLENFLGSVGNLRFDVLLPRTLSVTMSAQFTSQAEAPDGCH